VGGRWFVCGRGEESWRGEFGRKFSFFQTCFRRQHKTNHNENFSKMVKIQKTNQNEQQTNQNEQQTKMHKL